MQEQRSGCSIRYRSRHLIFWCKAVCALIQFTMLLPVGVVRAAADDDPRFFTYAASVISGNQRPSEPAELWEAETIPFRLHYNDQTPLSDAFPDLQPSLAWIYVSFGSMRSIPLAMNPDVSAASGLTAGLADPGIDFYILRTGTSSSTASAIFANVAKAFPAATSTEDGRITNCHLQRFSASGGIVKSIGILTLSAVEADNVKCLSATILFGLGLDVAQDALAPKEWYGVMTLYLDSNHTLPDPHMDMDLLGIVYGAPANARGTRAELLKYISIKIAY